MGTLTPLGINPLQTHVTLGSSTGTIAANVTVHSITGNIAMVARMETGWLSPKMAFMLLQWNLSIVVTV